MCLAGDLCGGPRQGPIQTTLEHASAAMTLDKYSDLIRMIWTRLLPVFTMLVRQSCPKMCPRHLPTQVAFRPWGRSGGGGGGTPVLAAVDGTFGVHRPTGGPRGGVDRSCGRLRAGDGFGFGWSAGCGGLGDRHSRGRPPGLCTGRVPALGARISGEYIDPMLLLAPLQVRLLPWDG